MEQTETVTLTERELDCIEVALDEMEMKARHENEDSRRQLIVSVIERVKQQREVV